MKSDSIKNVFKIIFTPNTDFEYIQQTKKILTKALIFLDIAVLLVTILNFVKGYIVTGILTSFIIFMMSLCILLNFLKVELRIITLLLTILFAFVLTFFAVTGANEGFAILWIMIIPSMFMGFLDMGWGFLLSLFFQIVLIVLFCTPLRNNFTEFYTQSFLSRFPVLYFADFSCTFLLMFERHKLRLKKNEFEDRLRSEMLKSDRLLHSIFPDKIAEDLKARKSFNEHVIAEDYENVSILFADIVGFTEISQHYDAKELVDALNDLFCRFDLRAKLEGIEKIKTIGDAYMVAAGLPEASEDNASRLALFALGMKEDLNDYNKNAKIKFKLRIGVSSGPVTAGVIGTTKFIYDVWGDTVNVASRMQAVADTDTIRITESVRSELLGKGFNISMPKNEQIKNHGVMTTYELYDNI